VVMVCVALALMFVSPAQACEPCPAIIIAMSSLLHMSSQGAR
jgi:hypothetical protein